MMKQFIFLLSTAFIMYPLSVWANPIIFDRIVGKHNPPVQMGSGGPPNTSPGSHGSFYKRYLNENENILKKIYESKINFSKSVKKIGQNKFLLYIDPDLADKNRAMYLIEKHQITGYSLLDVFDVSRHMDDPVLAQIRALPENPGYLSGQLLGPPGVTLRIYQKDHGDFIERYIFLSHPYKEMTANYLVLDAYYPKKYESEFIPEILDFINPLSQAISEYLQNNP